MIHSVYIKKRFNHPVEKVWKYLTVKEYMEKWMFNVNSFELKENGDYHLVGEPNEDWDGNIYGKVLEVIENEKFVHTFKTTNMNESTIVTWVLEKSEDGGTFLTLTHKGNESLEDIQRIFESTDFGWMHHLSLMTKLINNQ